MRQYQKQIISLQVLLVARKEEKEKIAVLGLNACVIIQ